jgi:hypothetical protein
MDYGRLFSRAWEITWENKYLWVLGFLVALGTGGGGSGGRANFSTGGGPGPGPQIENFLEQYGVLLAGVGCLLVIIGIILWLVRMVAEAGLISSVERIEGGSKLTLGEAFSSGTPFLGRMVGLNLLIYLPALVLAVLGLGSFLAFGGLALFGAAAAESPEAMFGSLGILFPCLCLLICVLALFSLVVSVIYPFAARSAVLGNMGAIDSIRNGWNVVRSHLGEVIVIWIIMIVIGLVFGFVAAAVLLPLGFLAAGPAFFRMMSGGSVGFTEIAPIVVGGLCIGVLAALINSVMTTYQSAVFTLAYRQLAEKSPPKPVLEI